MDVCVCLIYLLFVLTFSCKYFDIAAGHRPPILTWNHFWYWEK